MAAIPKSEINIKQQTYCLIHLKRYSGVIFTITKTLLSHLLTGTLLMKNSTSRENCDSRAW